MKITGDAYVELSVYELYEQLSDYDCELLYEMIERDLRCNSLDFHRSVNINIEKISEQLSIEDAKKLYNMIEQDRIKYYCGYDGNILDQEWFNALVQLRDNRLSINQDDIDYILNIAKML